MCLLKLRHIRFSYSPYNMFLSSETVPVYNSFNYVMIIECIKIINCTQL